MKKQLTTGVMWMLIVFIGGLFMLLALPRALGGQSMAVLSGSMSPAVKTGDEIVVLPVRARDLKPGEIAVFNDPEDASRTLNHRVQSVVVEEDGVSVVTLGDSNSKPEKWTVPTSQEVGKVVARVPLLGHLLGRLNSRLVLLGLLVLPALVLCGSFLVAIWRQPEGEASVKVEAPR